MLYIIVILGLIARFTQSTSQSCAGSAPAKPYGAAESLLTTFENPPFPLGSPNNHGGWTRVGVYDQVVVAQSKYHTFGKQSLQISNAITSGSFDQTYAKALTNSVAEQTATGPLPAGTRHKQFVLEFDIGSSTGVYQKGLHAEVSPDSGNGGRMSLLRFEDGKNGIDVWFGDVQGISLCVEGGNQVPCGNFVDKKVAKSLSRKTAHRIKLVIDVKEGPSNDVVNVYVDCKLVHTGTTWEDYYYYDPESFDTFNSRMIKTVIFQTRDRYGTQPTYTGKGFLFDNVRISALK